MKERPYKKASLSERHLHWVYSLKLGPLVKMCPNSSQNGRGT
jgi:hypothetical protein